MAYLVILRDVTAFFDELYPLSLQEEWDNAGLQLGDPARTVDCVLLCMDITRQTIRQADEYGAQLIVTHHPLIFKPLRSVDAQDFTGWRLLELARREISVLSLHTNLDIAAGGVNDMLADALELEIVGGLHKVSCQPYTKIRVFVPSGACAQVQEAMARAGAGELGGYQDCAFTFAGTGTFLGGPDTHPFLGEPGKRQAADESCIEMLCPPSKADAVVAAMRSAHPYEVPAFDLLANSAVEEVHYAGRMCRCAQTEFDDFAAFVKEKLGCRILRHNNVKRTVSRIAVCGGAGLDYYEDALRMDADTLLSGDGKYFDFLAARDLNVNLIDAGHFCTERMVLTKLHKQLTRRFPLISCHIAQEQDPVCYI